MVAVEHPDPPEEAKFNTESKGDMTPEVDELSSGDEAHANFSGVFQGGIMPGSPEYETFRVQEVIIQRLLKELCQIEGLKERVLQGCELDAAQREKLGREDSSHLSGLPGPICCGLSGPTRVSATRGCCGRCTRADRSSRLRGLFGPNCVFPTLGCCGRCARADCSSRLRGLSGPICATVARGCCGRCTRADCSLC